MPPPGQRWVLCSFVFLFLAHNAVAQYGGGGGEYYYEEEPSGGGGVVSGGSSAAIPPGVTKIVDLQQERVTALSSWLLDGYNRYRMPRVKGGLKVEVEISLVQFISVSTSSEFIEIEAWWRYYWTDPRLAWNQTQWGVDVMTFTTNEIWIPDIIAYEHLDDKETITDASVYPSGLVFKSTPRKTKLGCPMNLVAFPFDFQECTFTVGSWSWSGLDLDVVPREMDVSHLLVHPAEFPDRSALDMSSYVEFNSWRIDTTRVVWKNQYYACCTEPYPVLIYQFRIVRSSRTHFTGIIGPMILVTLIAFAVLLMPAPLSGSRPAISITMMLTSVTVYFVASRSTPQSMQSTVVGRLYAAGIVLCSLNVFNSILATALNQIAPEEKVSNQALMEFFHAFDKDNSGVLEAEELDAVFGILGITSTERRDIMSVVSAAKQGESEEERAAGGGITIRQWKSLAELTMDDDDRGSYHNFLVKAIVSLGLHRQLQNQQSVRKVQDAVADYESREEAQAAAQGRTPPLARARARSSLRTSSIRAASSSAAAAAAAGADAGRLPSANASGESVSVTSAVGFPGELTRSASLLSHAPPLATFELRPPAAPHPDDVALSVAETCDLQSRAQRAPSAERGGAGEGGAEDAGEGGRGGEGEGGRGGEGEGEREVPLSSSSVSPSPPPPWVKARGGRREEGGGGGRGRSERSQRLQRVSTLRTAMRLPGGSWQSSLNSFRAPVPRGFRANKGIKALGVKLKQYTASDSSAQKMGKQLAATIDSWVLRLVLPAYLIYLAVEFAGAWMRQPVKPFQVGLTDAPSAPQVKLEFFDYRSEAGRVKHYEAIFHIADGTTPIDIAYQDLRKEL